MSLPADFLDIPIAHRGLHDRDAGIVENSPAAFAAAIAAGYGIELDVQVSADGVPMVFHDEDLDRLTVETGPLRHRSAKALRAIPLTGSADRIEPLDRVLAAIGPRAPVLVEIKDQSAFPDQQPAALARATGRVLQAARAEHGARLAVMAFNPDDIDALEDLDPGIPRGLTTCAARDYPDRLPEAERAALGRFERFGPGLSFISHHHEDLDNRHVAALKAAGTPILCWTIRTPAEEAAARRTADNITFESYRP